MSPKVSIVIPNYNHAPFLQQRLDSVFNQTYQDFEVILLDDASTDGSQKTLLTYKDHPKLSHVVFNEFNSGSPFKQWQKGIALAKGDYIWIAESDDYCELNFLEELINKFKTGIVLVYCASMNVNEHGSILGINKWAYPLNSTKWQSDYKNKGKEEINKFLKFRNTIPNASAVLFKRKEALKINFPIDMFFCGDWYIWVALLKLGDVYYSSKALNYFRSHPNTTRGKKLICEEQQQILEFYKMVVDNSSFIERVINKKKYEWIINYLLKRSDHIIFKEIRMLNMPAQFRLEFLMRLIKRKIRARL